ncbi:hypothetical protein V5E97_33530 [Singulisphaera sp. Ch08]|uniref:Uncharacterized protein n=1 Tax=Singulisphaera sp. Ch08 TaxID=3120278 RepID=A0AAU7CDI2_9BACT
MLKLASAILTTKSVPPRLERYASAQRIEMKANFRQEGFVET